MFQIFSRTLLVALPPRAVLETVAATAALTPLPVRDLQSIVLLALLLLVLVPGGLAASDVLMLGDVLEHLNRCFVRKMFYNGRCLRLYSLHRRATVSIVCTCITCGYG